MSDSCTLVCRQIDFGELSQAVSAAVTDVGAAPTSTEQTAEDGRSKMRLTFPQSSLTFAYAIFKEPGDFVARTLLGMRNFFRRINTDAVEAQQSILQFTLEARTLIGVVAEPEYSDDDLHIDVVFAVAKRLDALVFNGAAILDVEGNILLDVDGRQEM